MNAHLAQFERQFAWLRREFLRCGTDLRSVNRLSELHARTRQLAREFNQFLERNGINQPIENL